MAQVEQKEELLRTADFSLLDPEFLLDPYPTYAKLRRQGPVLWHDESKSWFVTCYKECLQMLRDPGTFAADKTRAGHSVDPAMRNIQSLDPPEHLAVRRILKDAVTNKCLERVSAATKSSIREIDTTIGAHMDLVQDIAIPASVAGTVALLGVNNVTDREFRTASAAIVAGMMEGAAPEFQEPSRQAREVIDDRLRELYYAAEPGTYLERVRAATESAGVSAEATVRSVRVMMLAGMNSTQRFLAPAIDFLGRQGEGLAGIGGQSRGDRLRMVNELLRFDSPAQAAERFCVTDTEFGDVRLARGDSVVALLGAACRDGRAFDRPDELDLKRSPNRHLAFGAGAHACLGKTIFFSQVDAVLEQLAGSVRRLGATAEAKREQNPALRGLLSAPVEVLE